MFNNFDIFTSNKMKQNKEITNLLSKLKLNFDIDMISPAKSYG